MAAPVFALSGTGNLITILPLCEGKAAKSFQSTHKGCRRDIYCKYMRSFAHSKDFLRHNYQARINFARVILFLPFPLRRPGKLRLENHFLFHSRIQGICTFSYCSIYVLNIRIRFHSSKLRMRRCVFTHRSGGWGATAIAGERLALLPYVTSAVIVYCNLDVPAGISLAALVPPTAASGLTKAVKFPVILVDVAGSLFSISCKSPIVRTPIVPTTKNGPEKLPARFILLGIGLFNSQFLCDIFRKGIFIHDNVHRFVGYKRV